MGRYMRFEQSAGFDVLARYTQFMYKHRKIYDDAQPYSDVALVLPRQSVWNGRPDALDEFRGLGQALVERQVLLDVVADENITPDRLSKYRAVILPKAEALSDKQLEALRKYSTNGLILQRGKAASTNEDGQPRSDSKITDAINVQAKRSSCGCDRASSSAARSERHQKHLDGSSMCLHTTKTCYVAPRKL